MKWVMEAGRQGSMEAEKQRSRDKLPTVTGWKNAENYAGKAQLSAFRRLN